MRWLESMSLQWRLVLILAVVVLLCMTAFEGYLGVRLREVAAEDAEKNLAEKTLLVKQLIASNNETLELAADRWSASFRAEFAGEFVLDPAQKIVVAGTETPALLNDGALVNLDFTKVDHFSEVSGGNVATVFVRKGDDFVRVATSLRKEDGTRAHGTFLGKSHPGYAKALAGEEYVGKARLFGKDYMTAYRPVKDASGEVIALLFIGMDLSASLEALREAVRAIRIGETGRCWVLDADEGPSRGTVLIHAEQEGTNLLGARDTSGRPFVEEMLRQGEGILQYETIDAARGTRETLSAFTLFPDWRWLIVSSGDMEEMGQVASEVSRISLTATLITTLVVVLGLAFLLRRAVVVPLQTLHGVMRRLATDHDLTVRSGSTAQDEVGALAQAFDTLSSALGALVLDLRGAAGDMERQATTILDNVSRQSSLASQQAAAISQTSTIITEIAQTSLQATTKANSVISTAQRSEALGREGGDAVDQAMARMKNLAEQVQVIAASMVGLSERILRIREVIATVEDLAEQSNLLALNAAMEAANAGERGRGFAVVAQEMRSLAQQSKKAGEEVRGILSEVLGGLRKSVEATEEGKARAEAALGMAEQAGGAITGLSEAVRDSTLAARQIAENTKQQTLGVDQIAAAVSELSIAINESLADTKRTEEVAVMLTELSKRLSEVVGRYRV